MEQISQFLTQADGGIAHYCPACKDMHLFHTDKPNPQTGGLWEWDGNIVAPTLSPKMLIRMYIGRRIVGVCHYTLTAGQITFLRDCTHSLAGLTMALPALPVHMRNPCHQF